MGPVQLGDPAPGHRGAPPPVAAGRDGPERPGRLRHDRDRARLGRRLDRDDRHVRRGDPGVRHPHPVQGRLEGLPRQRRAARQGGHGLRAADHPGRQPRRALLLRPHPGREGCLPARRGRRGRRPQGRTERHRQRPSALHPGPHPAHQPPQPLRRRGRGRDLLLAHRLPRASFLHDARHARPGPRLPVPRRHHGLLPRPARCAGLRGAAPPVQGLRPAAGGGAAGLPEPPAPPHRPPGPRLRGRLRLQRARREVRRRLLRPLRHGRGPAGARDARRGREAPDHVARPGHPAGGPRGVRRRRVPRREPGGPDARRPGRVRHVRGRQHGAPAAGGQASADRLLEGVRTSQRGRRLPLRGPSGLGRHPPCGPAQGRPVRGRRRVRAPLRELVQGPRRAA